jgi:AcrR family transcriptional regulator
VGVKSRRQEYKELTRAAVLRAAADQFISRGYVATTIDDVARAARVSKGTVYYHFQDKSELFEAVFRDRQNRLVAAVAATVGDTEGGPWEQFHAGVLAFLDGTITDAAHRALLQQAPGALGLERCAEIDEGIGLPVLRVALQRVAEAGEINPQPIDMLARVIFSALCEAAMAAGRDADPARAHRDAAAVLGALIGGLRAERRPPAGRSGRAPGRGAKSLTSG